MQMPKKGAIHYHAQLGLLRQRSCNHGLVVRWVLLNLIPRVFGQKRRDLAPLSYPGLLDLTLKCHVQQPRPYEISEASIYI